MTTLAVASQTGGALDFARAHVRRAVPYRFTPREQMVLELFFSNTDQHVFLVENLPSNVRASLLAMYSRMKNERGLRGVFVDVLVTNFLASNLESVIANYPDDTPRFLRENHIRTLDEFADSSGEAAALLREFLESSTGNPGYIRKFANGDKTRKFLSTWLDQYGHNSIARLGEVVVCCEEISILAAKALEHPRAGAGFIELSTRYVDMTKASWYPIAGEIRAAGQHEMQIEDTFRMFAHVYLTQMERYTQFLGELYPDASEGAIFGEVCDVMANALPAATNTSVGCVVSGEALRSLIKCLLLEGLPETTALAEAIMAELEQSGLGQFARHVEPTEFEIANSGYLNIDSFFDSFFATQPAWTRFENVASEIEDTLSESFMAWRGADGFNRWVASQQLGTQRRSTHDKLPPVFENTLMRFKYTTTFRTWREIQRHVLSQNERTLLTPSLGFFQHSKPISDELKGEFGRIQVVTEATHAAFVAGGGVSLETLQYLVPMGFHVGATHTSNLRQLEFLCWQRSGWNVNHEARQVILGFDAQALKLLSWWEIVSRTDRTPAYRLAREKVGVPIG